MVAELGIADGTVFTPSSASEVLENSLEDMIDIFIAYTSQLAVYVYTKA
jgi:hypothetical protein